MAADAPTEENAPRSTENDALRPSDLKEKFAEKMAEIRANQKRDLPKTPRTEEEQRIVRFIPILLDTFHNFII